MNKVAVIGSIVTVVVVVGFVVLEKREAGQVACTMEAKICPDGSAVGRSGPNCEFTPCPDAPVISEKPNNSDKTVSKNETVLPLDRAEERVTKKPFGIFIDPRTSPVRPERFRGYHTGTDFEIFTDERVEDVTVTAICDGEVVAKKTASGYGGVVVTSCMLDGEPVTVVYGHLALASVSKKSGEKIRQGETLAILGMGESVDTDGERKHLHLGIHQGKAIDIRGYVADKRLLSEWIDPCRFVCGIPE